MSNTNDATERPSDNEIRDALERVTSSATFRVSRRLVAFLRYVVETDLAGDQASIKGFTIAVEALGRSPDFDPQANAIVRVEAARLRRTLDRYYAGPGARDPIVIEIPRGRYVPVYRRRTFGQTPAVSTARSRAAAFFVPLMQWAMLKFEGQVRRCRVVAGLD